MREDTSNPDFSAEQTGENRDEPSFSPLAAGKENSETTSKFIPQSDENAGAPRDHWEQEKAKLSLALTERLLRGRDTVAFFELKTSSLLLHERLGNAGEIALAVLRRHAREIIRQEKPLLLQSKRRFELDDAEIRTELRQLRDSLAERLFFDRNELHAALALGVRLQFDLITKPAATLKRLIYARAAGCNKDDLNVILSGFDANHPFISHLQSLLAAHADGLITTETFAALCRQAEKEIYGRRVVSALMADLQAYQNFCALIGPSSYHRIEAQTVLDMLRERGLYELAERLSPDLAQQKGWSIPEIELLLEEREHVPVSAFVPPETSAPVIKPEAEFGDMSKDAAEKESPDFFQTDKPGKAGIEEKPWPPAEAQIDLELTPEDLALPEVETPSNGKEMTVPAETAEPAPPTSINATEMHDEPVSWPATGELSEIAVEPSREIEAPPLPVQPKVVYQDIDGDEPRFVERAKLEAQPPGPYPSITRLLDEKSRRDFIRKIFHKDLDAYLAFIERIENMETWKEAKAFLDREFQQRKVSPYSKEAVRLSDVVFSRYFAKGAR